MKRSELKRRVIQTVDGRAADFHLTKKVIKLILQYTGEVSSDDVRFYVKEFSPSRAVIGKVFQTLVHDKEIVRSGDKPSDIKTSHGRRVAVYQAT